jgi:hypothetical protein
LASRSYYKKEIVMGYNLTGDQLKTAAKRIGELLRLVGQAEFPYEPEGFLRDLQSLIERGRLAATMIIEAVYSPAFDAMVNAGKYDHVDPDFTEEHFSTSRIGTVRYKAVLVHIGRRVSAEEAKAEIERKGLVPASAAELCAFGAKYTEEQREYPIVALGQFWPKPSGDLYFPCLWVVDCGRCLLVSHYVGVWGAHCRFLALREIP